MTVDNYYFKMGNENKSNKQILSEEIKRFNSLTNYDSSEGLITEFNYYMPENFYETEDELLEADDEVPEDEDIEAEPEGDVDIDAEIEDVAGEIEGGDEAAPEGDEEMDLGDDMGDEEIDLGGDEDLGLGDEEMADEGGDEVEIDVTELVNSTEEAKQASDGTNQKMEDLMGQFGQLQTQLEKMNGLSSKIDDLEHEMETRMPTPEEKLEMRSLDSYPYNVKLTDYWSDKEGKYDVMDGEDENNGEPKEYVLTKDEVESDYNEMSVKDSIDNPFEEEDIKNF